MLWLVEGSGYPLDAILRFWTALVQPQADFVAAYLELIGLQIEPKYAVRFRFRQRLSIDLQVNPIPRDQGFQLRPELKRLYLLRRC